MSNDLRGVALDATGRARAIRSKRRRAMTLSKKLATHEATARERVKLWDELHTDFEVDVATLAADSGVTPMAVRKALTNYRRST